MSQQIGEENNANIGGLRQGNSESPTATNAKHHYCLVEEMLQNSTKSLLEYKKDQDILRQELALMKQRVLNFNEETGNILSPQIDADLRDLQQAISAQKDENGKLQSQITEIKKEACQIQQLIITCVQKLAQLETKVGNYS